MHYCVANFPRPAVPSQMRAPDERRIDQPGDQATFPHLPGDAVSGSTVSQSQSREQTQTRSEGSLVHFLLTKFNLRDILSWLGGHWYLKYSLIAYQINTN